MHVSFESIKKTYTYFEQYSNLCIRSPASIFLSHFNKMRLILEFGWLLPFSNDKQIVFCLKLSSACCLLRSCSFKDNYKSSVILIIKFGITCYAKMNAPMTNFAELLFMYVCNYATAKCVPLSLC